jgi:hypothetical protein
VVLTDEGIARVTHGRQLEVEHYSAGASAPATSDAGSGWTRIFDSGGRLTALGTAGTTAGSLHPAIVLI